MKQQTSRRRWLAMIATSALAVPGNALVAQSPPVSSNAPLVPESFGGRRMGPATMRLAADSKRVTNHAARIASRTLRLPPVDPRVQQVVVTAIAVDPLGQWLAVAGDDHVIRILSVETMRVIHTLGDGQRSKTSLPGHSDLIRTMAFDPDGNRLASAGNDGHLIMWDRRREFELLQEIGSAPALACVRFSPSGKQLAAVGFDSEVFLISKHASLRPRIRVDCNDLRCCLFRDDGAVLAIAGRDGHLHLVDPRSGETVLEKRLHRGRIRDLAFLPSSNVLVSVAEDGELVRWDSERGEELSRIKVSSGRLFSVAIMDSQRIAAAGSDDVIHLVRVSDDGRTLLKDGHLRGHVGSVSSLASVGTVLFSGGFDATLRRWDLDDLGTADSKIALTADDTSNDEASPR